MRTFLASIMSIIVIAGCATPEQQAAAMMREADRMVQIYGPACDKLGFKSGTDQWRNCILQLSTKEELPYTYPPYGYWGPYGRYWW